MLSRKILFPFIVGAAVVGPGAFALEMTADGDFSVEHTDNARKSSSNEIAETQQRLGLSLSGVHGGESVTADFRYRADHRFYNDNSQSERTILEGTAAVRWEQIAESLFWDLSHRRKDVMQDNALTDIRENRDERDITELSPLYILRLTPADVLQARARYSNVMYRRADDFDSQRYGANLAWRRLISPTSTLNVAIDSNEVDFESRLQTDYRHDSASVAYAVTLAQLNYQVVVGANKATREEGDNVTGPLLGLLAEYDDGLNRWYGRFDSRITDSSLGDGNRDIFDSIDTADMTVGVVDVIEKTDFELGVRSAIACDRCDVKAAIFFDREEYDSQPRDNDEYGAELDATYRLSRQASITVSYRYRSVEYKGDDNPRSDFDQHEYLVTYSRRVMKDLRAEVFGGFVERTGSRTSTGFGNEYDETRVGVRLRYVFF